MITVTAANALDAATILKRLSEPFPESEIKLKPAMVKNNRCLALAYIDARHVMDRLDEVVGIDGWKDEYTLLPGGTEVECRLSLRVGGEWITKADVGGESEQPDGGDKMKAAYSDALKRAAVKFGVGRFLYRRPQQWMDYDPVKRQIVRPPERPQQHQSKPQPEKKAVPDNLQRRAFHTQAYAQCKTHKDYLAARSAAVKDIETGALSQADVAALKGLDVETLKRCPAPEPAKA